MNEWMKVTFEAKFSWTQSSSFDDQHAAIFHWKIEFILRWIQSRWGLVQSTQDNTYFFFSRL